MGGADLPPHSLNPVLENVYFNHIVLAGGVFINTLL